jgi:hypothetical protein
VSFLVQTLYSQIQGRNHYPVPDEPESCEQKLR